MDAPQLIDVPVRRTLPRLLIAVCLMLVSSGAHGQSWISEDWLGVWNDPPANPDWMTSFDKLDSSTPHRFAPLFGFEAGAVVLGRSHPDSWSLVETDGTMGPVETIATSDIMEPNAKAGPRFTATMYNLTDRVPGLDMEFTYFKVDSGSYAVVSASGYNTTDIVPQFFGGVPAIPEASYTLLTASRLKSYDWMMSYRPYARLRFMMGLRWLDLTESFDTLETDDLPSVSGFFADSDNELFGWQIGGEAIVWSCDYLRAFVRVKYARLENESSGTAVTENLQYPFSGKQDSNLVDLEIGGSVPFGEWAAFTVAYQGLFLSDGVGAFEQSNLQSFFVPASQVSQHHEIEWHGVQFMFSVIW